VQQVRLVRPARRALTEQLAQQVPQAQPAHKVLRANKAFRATLAPQVQLARQAHKVLKVMLARKAIRVRKETMV
jgi:hypothetical protein